MLLCNASADFSAQLDWPLLARCTVRLGVPTPALRQKYEKHLLAACSNCMTELMILIACCFNLADGFGKRTHQTSTSKRSGS